MNFLISLSKYLTITQKLNENKGSKVKVDNKVSSSTLVDKTTAILRKHSSTIKQTVTAKQNIIITCGDGK